MAVSQDYTVDYSDKRLTEVEADKNSALNKLNETYDSMIGKADAYYESQVEATKDWAEKQTQIQQEKTDFAIEQVEHQKEQAKKDYLKEQSGAYVDWQKQSGEYGANAEAMAAKGMTGTGYSESAQVSMYNTYQNRVATARESYNKAVLNYDNAIKDAQLQNNSILAEIAYNSLQTQLELSLEGFQYKNQLIMAKTDAAREVENTYHNRYQDVLAQINHENALAEEVRQYNASLEEEKRQYNESLAFQKAQLEEEKRQYNETMAYNKSKAAKSSSGSSGSSSGGSAKKSSGGNSKNTNNSVKNNSKNTASVRNAIDTIVREGTNAGKTNSTVKTEVNKVLNAAVKDGTMTKAEATAYKRAMRNQVF